MQQFLPYGGTSGHSGSETSKERAINNDKTGKTGINQQLTLTHLKHNGSRGLTWKELSEITNWHHGTSSGVLSTLHLVGKIERLEERRNRCAVYVMPEYAFNRIVSKRKVKTCKNCGHKL